MFYVTKVLTIQVMGIPLLEPCKSGAACKTDYTNVNLKNYHSVGFQWAVAIVHTKNENLKLK